MNLQEFQMQSKHKMMSNGDSFSCKVIDFQIGFLQFFVLAASNESRICNNGWYIIYIEIQTCYANSIDLSCP